MPWQNTVFTHEFAQHIDYSMSSCQMAALASQAARRALKLEIIYAIDVNTGMLVSIAYMAMEIPSAAHSFIVSVHNAVPKAGRGPAHCAALSRLDKSHGHPLTSLYLDTRHSCKSDKCPYVSAPKRAVQNKMHDAKKKRLNAQSIM